MNTDYIYLSWKSKLGYLGNLRNGRLDSLFARGKWHLQKVVQVFLYTGTIKKKAPTLEKLKNT